MVVERLATATLALHDSRACLRIGLAPIYDSILEQVIEKIVEPVGRAAPSPPRSQTTHAADTRAIAP